MGRRSRKKNLVKNQTHERPFSSSCGRKTFLQFSSVQFSYSVVSDSAAPWTAVSQASLSNTNSRSLLKLMFIESINHLILCRPLLLPPSIFPSIRVFSNESALCISWPRYCSFSFSISPSNEYLGLISYSVPPWLPPCLYLLPSLPAGKFQLSQTCLEG